MQEIWKDIKGYEGLYKISNYGNIFGVKRKKELKRSVGKTINEKNTYVISLCKDGVCKTHSIHSLVFKTFIGEPKGMIDFKDSHSENLHVDNLIDVDKTFNFKTSQCKRVINTKTMEMYDSINDLERKLKVSYGTIYKSLNRKSKKYSHYKIID